MYNPQKGRENKNKTQNRQKIKKKMRDLNAKISIITLNINSLKISLYFDWQSGFKENRTQVYPVYKKLISNIIT